METTNWWYAKGLNEFGCWGRGEERVKKVARQMLRKQTWVKVLCGAAHITNSWYAKGSK